MSTIDSPERIHQSDVSPWPTGSRYGMIAALILVVIGLVFYLTGLSDPTGQEGGAGNWISSLLNWVVMAGAIYLATREHRDEELGGYMTYGRGVGIGSVVSLVIAGVTLVWTYVFMAFVATDLVENIRYQMEEQMREQQGMSEAEIEQAMSIAGMFAEPWMIALMAGVITFVTGLIFSLIIAAVMRNDPPETA